MEYKTKKKCKLLYVLKYLCENSDDENGVTVIDIIDYLSTFNIESERKSIYSDIKILMNFGIEIDTYRIGNITYYKLINRYFKLSELKLLIDSVQYSQFIPPIKKKELTEKISKLTSKNNADDLVREIYINTKTEKCNKNIFNNVDIIFKAINKNKKITFYYFKWDQNKKKCFRGNGVLFSVSPYKLIVDTEKYYLLAYDDYENVVKTYRVDRMENMLLKNEKREGCTEIDKIDINHYTQETFGMFGGKARRILLRCDNKFSGMIIDKFGMDIRFSKFDENKFEIMVKVIPSNLFFGWVLGTLGGIEIIEPKEVKEDMINMMKNVFKEYN